MFLLSIMALDKEGKALLKKMQKYADSQNFKLNENQTALEGIINALLRNKKFKGEIYCPCRIVSGNKKEDEKIICPCVYHQGEIELQGNCKCTLFWKK